MSSTRSNARSAFTMGTLMLALVWVAACNMEPDIVGRATDAGLGLDDNDSGEPSACETSTLLTPVSSMTNCVYAVPLPLPEDFSPFFFNVNAFEDGKLVPYAGDLRSVGDCAHVLHGWYWVDPPEYTQIGFCPQTCELASQWEALAFQFGCATLQAPWFAQPPRPPRP